MNRDPMTMSSPFSSRYSASITAPSCIISWSPGKPDRDRRTSLAASLDMVKLPSSSQWTTPCTVLVSGGEGGEDETLRLEEDGWTVGACSAGSLRHPNSARSIAAVSIPARKRRRSVITSVPPATGRWPRPELLLLL